jgi:hypothetical protein
VGVGAGVGIDVPTAVEAALGIVDGLGFGFPSFALNFIHDNLLPVLEQIRNCEPTVVLIPIFTQGVPTFTPVGAPDAGVDTNKLESTKREVAKVKIRFTGLPYN